MSKVDATLPPGEETEEQLINTALEAVSQCRWVVGECAARWTQRYARGRTDADFALLIGISPDQVYQRRRVWEAFGAIRGDFRSLKWSHFYAALNWDDALECLRWSEEMQATVAEMRAWRRAQRGEDLTVEAAEDDAVRYLPTEPEFVQDPAEFAGVGGRGEPRVGDSGDRTSLVGVARQAGDDRGEYTPFRPDAVQPVVAGGRSERGSEPPEPPTPEQLVKRMTSTLERCVKVLSPEFRKDFRRLPEPIRNDFLDAVATLTECASHLK
jgi:hypothetical protein